MAVDPILRNPSLRGEMGVNLLEKEGAEAMICELMGGILGGGDGLGTKACRVWFI